MPPGYFCQANMPALRCFVVFFTTLQNHKPAAFLMYNCNACQDKLSR